MTERQIQERFARQRPGVLPASNWADVLRRARVRTRRRSIGFALAATLVLLTLAGAALGYDYLSGPVSPSFRLYLARLTRSGFDPAQARIRVAVNVPGHVVLLWTAPSTQYRGSLVWGFQVQLPAGQRYNRPGIRDLGAGCCGDTTGAIAEWGGQALSQRAGHELWLEAGHASRRAVRVTVRFQDGSGEDASIHDGFFVAAIGAAHYQAGHRPVALVAYDHSGVILGRATLDPSGFRRTTQSGAELHPRARGRAIESFPLLTGGSGQIWIDKGLGGYSWSLVVGGRDQLLGGGYAPLSVNPSNRRSVQLSALRYQAHGRREIIYGGDAWDIRSLVWVHPDGARTRVAIVRMPPRAWPYIGNLTTFQVHGSEAAGGVLIARDRRGRIAQRINLGKVFIQPTG